MRRTSPTTLDRSSLGAIFAESATPMLLADDQRRFTDANAAALDLLGQTLPAIRRLRIDDITPEHLRPLAPAMWDQFIADGVMTGEYELMRPDGSLVMVQFNATANVAEGQHLTIFIRHSDLPGLPSGHDGRQQRGPLSPRERQVLRLIALGYDGPAIADQLGISHGTVRVHARNAIRKLGAKTRAQAIGIAIANGDI